MGHEMLADIPSGYGQPGLVDIQSKIVQVTPIGRRQGIVLSRLRKCVKKLYRLLVHNPPSARGIESVKRRDTHDIRYTWTECSERYA